MSFEIVFFPILILIYNFFQLFIWDTQDIGEFSQINIIIFVKEPIWIYTECSGR
jgi:hypothetical protein